MAPARGLAWSVALIVTILSSIVGAAEHNEQIPLGGGGGAETERKRPNFLFVITDDQDLHMDSLSYMPYLQKHITDKGTTFNRHYCTVALCCPSRVSLWTGKAAHNTNVTDVSPPWGGYPKFIEQGFNDKYLPVWLQEAGYGTYYVGKLFNAQNVKNYNDPHAAGWTGSDFLLDPYTYSYLHPVMQRNHEPPRDYKGQYSTDLVARKAEGFLDDALADLKENDKPFFLTVAPMAPHCDFSIEEEIVNGNKTMVPSQGPPVPAERHRHLFIDAKVPRTPHFNPDKPGGGYWMRKLPQQPQKVINYNDHFYRNRLRTLQPVDEMIDSLMRKLEEADVLDNTYVFFSTDNGFHIGQHRLQPGKQCAFEEDINIPMMVRGPDIAEGATTDIVTSHIDLAPTFLSLAGVTPKEEYGFDGTAIPLTDLKGAGEEWSQEHINVEMWGIIVSEGNWKISFPNHTYKALRVIGEDYSLLYTVWCNNDHELYDLKTDPWEMDNIYPKHLPSASPGERNHSTPLPDFMQATTSFQWTNELESEEEKERSRLVHRLDSLLMVLKTCKGRECTHPWESLHPKEQVKNLHDALDPRFDAMYESHYRQARVEYQECERGYIAESELPVWDGGKVYGMFDEMSFS